MTKKNLTICGIPYEEYQVMKYNQLAKVLSEQEDYDAYCKQMEKEMDDYISQIDQDDLINQ